MHMPLAKYEIVDTSYEFGGWIVLALMLPGLIILFGAVIAFIVRRKSKSDTAEAETAGYYRVLGVDENSGQRRESFFHANSRSGAEGRARMEGIVVTEIHRVDDNEVR